MHGLDISGVDIKSYVYGYDISNSSLLLEINKNNKPFIHLSIHLCPKSFDPKSSGPIHIYKDVYESYSSTTKMRYVLMYLQQRENATKRNKKRTTRKRITTFKTS